MIYIPTSPKEIDEYIKGHKDEIVARECKHGTYTVGQNGDHDLLTVKEWVTFKNGLRLPTLKLFRDYKRPIWITKEPYRDHDEKIQFEDLKRVDKVMCRQLDVTTEIYNRLRTGSPSWPIKRLARQPYVYGADFGPEAYLKQIYIDRYPDAFKPNKVTVFDAETNVFEEGRKPILWSEVNDDEIILYYNKKWTKRYPNYAADVEEAYRKTLPEYLDQIKKKLTVKGSYPEWIDKFLTMPLRFVEGDDQLDITLKMISHWHEKQDDIITGWNILFDMEVIHGTLIDGGHDPKNVLSDPRVPYEFRDAYLRPGPTEKVSAAGRSLRLDPQERWHHFNYTASWKMVDEMGLYWQLRKAKGKESGGYGLDATLNRQIGVGKVHMSAADSDVPSGTLHWHAEMQKKYEVSYGVYSIFDSIGVKALELKTNDLNTQISSLAGAIDYGKFNSQPGINSLDMHLFALKNRGKVLCTTSDQMETDRDQEILSRDGWMTKTVPYTGNRI